MFRLLSFALVVALLLVGLPVAADDSKPAGKEDAGKKELAKLQGMWVCFGCERDGKADTSERGAFLASLAQGGNKISIKGDKFTFYNDFAGQIVATSGSIKLHPTSDPKGLDRTWEESRRKDAIGKTELAVYEFDGEKTLRISFGELGGKERPKSLKTKQGDKHSVLIYVREK